MQMDMEQTSWNIPRLLRRNAQDFSELPALTAGTEDGADTWTWSQLRGEVAVIARGLETLGIQPGQRLLIMMSRRPEHWFVDLAAAHLGAISFTAYDTLSTDDIEYVANHSAAPIVVLEGAQQIERWRPILDAVPHIQKIVTIEAAGTPVGDDRFISYKTLRTAGEKAHHTDGTVFERMAEDRTADDPLCMIYTSGTTARPKGVVLSHRNVCFLAQSVSTLIPVAAHPRSISSLPLAHVAERTMGIYIPLYAAGHVTILGDLDQLPGALRAVHPHTLGAVPRVWEKLAIALESGAVELDAQEQDRLAEAREVTLELYRRRATEQPVTEDLERRAAEVEESVLRPFRKRFGLDALTRTTTGAAPIQLGLLESLASFGMYMLELWGLSEGTGAATVSTRECFAIGGAGRIAPGMVLRIAEDGEIMIRGPLVFLGYLQPDGTIERGVDPDGWLATGDLGRVDHRGILYVTGRKKEVLITAAGKNIAPVKIESLLSAHPLIAHAVAVGNARRYVTALLALDEQGVRAWANARSITGPLADLAAHPDLLKSIAAGIDHANTKLARPEQVKTFRLLPGPLTVETGELTPTFKVRRRVVEERYTCLIDDMYTGAHTALTPQGPA